MFGVILCVGLFFWLLSTRNRLDRAESELRDQGLKRTELEAALRALKQRLAELEARLQPAAAAPELAQSQVEKASHAEETHATEDPALPARAELEPAATPAPAPPPADAHAGQANRISPPPSAAAAPDPAEAAIRFIQELLFGGNTVVRAGIVVLLVGVVLLLRWAAEHARSVERSNARIGSPAVGPLVRCTHRFCRSRRRPRSRASGLATPSACLFQQR